MYMYNNWETPKITYTNEYNRKVFGYRPMQARVQKWFMKEHKLHICLDYLSNEMYSVCICTPDYAHDSDIIYDIEGTYEYSEGLSVGIDKCIELIKEKKNEK